MTSSILEMRRRYPKNKATLNMPSSALNQKPWERRWAAKKGTATKSRMAKKNDPVMLRIISFFVNFSFLCSCWLLLHNKPLMPSYNVYPKPITPRIKKTLKIFGKEVLFSRLTLIWPLGSRTAIVTRSLLRIMTPSMTAWPPTFMVVDPFREEAFKLL